MKPPIWYRIAAVALLAWGAWGAAAYLQQVSLTTEQVSSFAPAQRDLYLATPAWVNGTFAIAVWSGVAASIALLLRHRLALPLCILSLLAVIVQFSWVFGLARAHETIGSSAIAFPAFIAVMGSAAVWFASHASKRGWLR